MKDNTRSRRRSLVTGLGILVSISLLVAAVMLARLYARGPLTVVPLPPLELTPESGEQPDVPNPAEPQWVIPSEEMRELALALAAIVTALTGLLGLIATQVWRGREENRAEQKHALALERERLELERERLALEKERLDLARRRGELDRAE